MVLNSWNICAICVVNNDCQDWNFPVTITSWICLSDVFFFNVYFFVINFWLSSILICDCAFRLWAMCSLWRYESMIIFFFFSFSLCGCAIYQIWFAMFKRKKKKKKKKICPRIKPICINTLWAKTVKSGMNC